MQRKERERCEAHLINQPFVASIKELSLDINFHSVHHKLVHLPFYITVSFFHYQKNFKPSLSVCFISDLRNTLMVVARISGCVAQLALRHKGQGHMGWAKWGK